MTQRTVHSPGEAERHEPPLDVETMRTTARRLIAGGAEALGPDELDTYLSTLVGHMRLLIPEVEVAAGRQPKDDIPRYCALACVGEARTKLGIEVGAGLNHGIAHATRLARSVNALCDHYENLGGAHPGTGQ